ncbi:hypothetical protein M9H77_31648 [Catharanthus roseus]|uniref:Uncharacterized protein n=1 Tax=Catharanthus roseus TaxID=4058 RepID=A0ACC0A116_CATRO|nr:hypothetical protein M9H77_31648 [Catharanthus roseus]
MRRLAKGVLNLVLPKDPGVILTSPLEVAVTKGRKKTDSTKRDKSHWEHVQLLIERYRSQADLFLVLALDLGHCPVRVLGRDPVKEGDRHELLGKRAEDATVAEVIYLLPNINWKNVIGDRNFGYRVVADFVFGDEHQWPERNVLMRSFIGYIGHKFIQFVCDTNCTTWFYDCVTFVFVFGSSRKYIGYWSLDRRTTLYSATVE